MPHAAAQRLARAGLDPRLLEPLAGQRRAPGLLLADAREQGQDRGLDLDEVARHRLGRCRRARWRDLPRHRVGVLGEVVLGVARLDHGLADEVHHRVAVARAERGEGRHAAEAARHHHVEAVGAAAERALEGVLAEIARRRAADRGRIVAGGAVAAGAVLGVDQCAALDHVIRAVGDELGVVGLHQQGGVPGRRDDLAAAAFDAPGRQEVEEPPHQRQAGGEQARRPQQGMGHLRRIGGAVGVVVGSGH